MVEVWYGVMKPMIAKNPLVNVFLPLLSVTSMLLFS